MTSLLPHLLRNVVSVPRPRTFLILRFDEIGKKNRLSRKHGSLGDLGMNSNLWTHVTLCILFEIFSDLMLSDYAVCRRETRTCRDLTPRPGCPLRVSLTSCLLPVTVACVMMHKSCTFSIIHLTFALRCRERADLNIFSSLGRRAALSPAYVLI